MREILFRGKRADNGEWVEGYYANFNSDLHYIYTGYAETDVDSIYPDCFVVIPETVRQYTGLCDKNGNMIFEGDILKVRKKIFVVKFGDYEPKMFYNLLERYVLFQRPKEKAHGFFAEAKNGEQVILINVQKYNEVIGNIHDNPELLKEGAK